MSLPEEIEEEEEEEIISDDGGLTADSFANSLAEFQKESLKPDDKEKDKPKEEPEENNDLSSAEVVDKTTDDTKKDDEPTEPKAKLKWGELKKKAERADELEIEIVNFKKQLEESGLTQTKINELETKLKEKEEALEANESHLMVSRLESTKVFKEKVEMPSKALYGNVSRLAKTYGISIDDIAKALDNPDVSERNRQLTELSEGMNRRDQAEFDRTTDGLLSVIEAEAQLRADSKSAIEADKKRIEEEETSTKKKKSDEYKSASEAVWGSLDKKLGHLVDKALIADAKKNGDELNLDDAPADIRAGAAYAIQLVPHLTKTLEAKNARIKELEENLSKRSKPLGGAAQTTPGTGRSGDDDDDESESVGERFVKFTRG